MKCLQSTEVFSQGLYLGEASKGTNEMWSKIVVLGLFFPPIRYDNS